jgi:hypothetical protein
VSPGMDWPIFVDRVRRFACRNKVYSEGSPFRGLLGETDGVVHELCHWILLGYTLPRPVAAMIDGVNVETIVARVLRTIGFRQANSNECVAVGAEINVLSTVYPRWSRWHEARLLAYAQRGLELDYVHLVDSGATPYAKKRLARAPQTRQSHRVARAVMRAITNHGQP